MKITKIKIDKYRQFEDFELDLTYPAGHPKEGQPLDKVCIIGQSGTGKTTLLELVAGLRWRNVFRQQGGPMVFIEKKDEGDVEVFFQVSGMSFCASNVYQEGGTSLFLSDEEAVLLQLNSSIEPWGVLYLPVLRPTEWGHYFANNQAGMANFEGDSRIGFVVLVIGDKDSRNLWVQIHQDIKTYQTALSERKFRISDAVEKGANGSVQKLVDDLNAWKATQKNVLEDIAGYLKPVLSNFHLEVKTELSHLDQANFVTIMNKVGEIVPEAVWSSGLKNLIYKTVPLFVVKPKDFTILIDEPENSLYPDIQSLVVETYQKLAPECQFIFATHSPIIASSFEPWEIVDLEFDREGRVVQNLHLKEPAKGRHVDNFDANPRYLSYEGIYRKFFDYYPDGSEEREQKKQQAAELKGEAEYLKKQGKEDEAREKYLKYRQIASELGSVVP